MNKFTHINALYQVSKAVTMLNEDPDCPERHKLFGPVTFRGTVKLHGTNAGVRLHNGVMTPQSRSRPLSLDNDNSGFARFLYAVAQEEALRSIESRIRKALNIGQGTCLTLFGEWCGPNIQKGCGIHELPEKQFVIFAVVQGEGEDAVYLDAVPKLGNEFADASIYSIMDGPTWKLTIDFTSKSSLQMAADKATELTLAVEKQCPWAAKFGAEGIGEGIVWTPVGSHWGRTELYFKTKGAKHRVNAPREKKVQVDPEKLADAEEFLQYMVTENRLNQGVDYLREQGIPLENRAIGPFLKWFGQDVAREGATDLEANSLEWKHVSKAVNAKARNWFLQFLHNM